VHLHLDGQLNFSEGMPSCILTHTFHRPLLQSNLTVRIILFRPWLIG
jgi:hypothetical protein